MGHWQREIGEPTSWILAILAVALALGKWKSALDPGFYVSPLFISIIVAFLAHELAHKLVGRKYGMVTEFVVYTPGLLLTILSGLLPVVILAPGYVKTLIYYYTRSTEKGIVASVAAGPATNIIISLLSILLLTAYSNAYTTVHHLLAYMAWVNSWIAFFNLLPIPPLDGSKLASRSRGLWISLFAISLLLLVYIQL
ncbi:MAG: M50 family metallopeptidase [Desulfurococcales archaeon]|nr:M50 family metallopeptidase [Desulfurococcales archaeon]